LHVSSFFGSTTRVGETPLTASAQPDKLPRPGWPEIAIVGLSVMLAVVVHVVFNLLTIPVMAIAGMG
jgi:hypothetical protein